MIEAGLAATRLLQLAAGVIIFGVPAFALFGLRSDAIAAKHAWLRRILLTAVGVGIFAAVLMLSAEAAEMSGDPAMATDPQTVWDVASGTAFGAAWMARLALLGLLLGLVLVFPKRVGVATLSVCGAIVAASLAWLGHGGEGGPALGTFHRAADVLHILAASFWIGALFVLAHLLGANDTANAHHALNRFSGIGSAVVATLVITGVVNTWALTQPRPLGEALTTPYATVLLIKIALFAGMLALAALNRWVLTPRMAAAGERADLSALKRSVGVETLLAVFVIAAVAVLGVLEPPNAG